MGGAYHISGTLGRVGVEEGVFIVLHCWVDGDLDFEGRLGAVAVKDDRGHGGMERCGIVVVGC